MKCLKGCTLGLERLRELSMFVSLAYAATATWYVNEVEALKYELLNGPHAIVSVPVLMFICRGQQKWNEKSADESHITP